MGTLGQSTNQQVKDVSQATPKRNDETSLVAASTPVKRTGDHIKRKADRFDLLTFGSKSGVQHLGLPKKAREFEWHLGFLPGCWSCAIRWSDEISAFEDHPEKARRSKCGGHMVAAWLSRWEENLTTFDFCCSGGGMSTVREAEDSSFKRAFLTHSASTNSYGGAASTTSIQRAKGPVLKHKPLLRIQFNKTPKPYLGPSCQPQQNLNANPWKQHKQPNSKPFSRAPSPNSLPPPSHIIHVDQPVNTSRKTKPTNQTKKRPPDHPSKLNQRPKKDHPKRNNKHQQKHTKGSNVTRNPQNNTFKPKNAGKRRSFSNETNNQPKKLPPQPPSQLGRGEASPSTTSSAATSASEVPSRRTPLSAKARPFRSNSLGGWGKPSWERVGLVEWGEVVGWVVCWGGWVRVGLLGRQLGLLGFGVGFWVVWGWFCWFLKYGGAQEWVDWVGDGWGLVCCGLVFDRALQGGCPRQLLQLGCFVRIGSIFCFYLGFLNFSVWSFSWSLCLGVFLLDFLQCFCCLWCGWLVFAAEFRCPARPDPMLSGPLMTVNWGAMSMGPTIRSGSLSRSCVTLGNFWNWSLQNAIITVNFENVLVLGEFKVNLVEEAVSVWQFNG